MMSSKNIKNIRKFISQVYKFQIQIYLLKEFNLNSLLLLVCRMMLNLIKFHLLIIKKIKHLYKMIKLIHLKLIIYIILNNYKTLMKNKKIECIIIDKKQMNKIKIKRKSLWRRMPFLKKSFKTNI